MPGMVGLVTRLPRDAAESRLCRMVEALRHENFYLTGTWIDATLGVYVGWVVRKSAAADGGPLRKDRDGVALLLSGETVAPGEDPARLNGRFHGLLADRLRKTVTLFNDRYGMHRLYYHEAPDAFYFAAEAKAILAVRPETRSLDPRGAGELVACGCVMDNRTIFRNIHVLPPASAWTLRDGAVEKRAVYFDPREWEEQSPLEPEAYYRELRDVFARCLPRYFDAPEPIAMSLTGGLDTRMILAWHRPAAGTLPCYTFGGMFRNCRDVIVARRVARACGQPHETIPVGDEFLSRFAHYAERTVYVTDGCVDVGRAADLYLNERAREIAPVRMTGNYGGELLRGVRTFKPAPALAGLFSPDFTPYVRQAADTYSRAVQGHPVSFAAFKQLGWNHHGMLALEETQLALRSPYLDNDLVRTVFRAPAAALAGNDVCLRLIEEGDPTLRRIRTDRGLAGAGGPSGSMSRALLEFLFKAEYAYDAGMPQWLARLDHQLAWLRLERLFRGRHKFHHYRTWYRGPLSRYVRDVLLDTRTRSRPYLGSWKVETMVEEHLAGTRNHTYDIHRILTLELVHRLFLDR